MANCKQDDSDEVSIGVEESVSLDRSLHVVTEHMTQAVRSIADLLHISVNIVRKKVNIDILTLGRSCVGKSQLVKTITKNDDIEVSPQLDHVTTRLNLAVLTLEHINFRFWDSRGIDNWSEGEEVNQLIEELKRKDIKPLFILYCAAAMGRVETNQVKRILRHFREQGILIGYVITNMYGASSDQREAQIQGGIDIMQDVFMRPAKRCGRLHYEFEGRGGDNENSCTKNDNGILIAVNSCFYKNEDLGAEKNEENVDVLMNYIAHHLNDAQLSQFVLMTMQNRKFWEKASDAVQSRLENLATELDRTCKAFLMWFSNLKLRWNRPTAQ